MSTSEQPRHLRITDTTLRDGSHAMAHQFTEEQVRATVHALDAAGVEVIEVTHGDGLGGSSFNYGFSRVDEIRLIAAGVEEATQAKIAVLLVPGIGTKDDLRNAREAGASVARIATHCTEADVSVQHFGLARDLGMETVGGAQRGKAIIVLNPVEPPMIMRDPVFCAIPADADTDAIAAAVRQRVAEVQRYVPGYTLRAEPQFDEARESWQGNARVAVFLEVQGAGDYLPGYAGNLDIMTSAAAQVGEVIGGRRAERVTA